jgi:hypothetical protein
MPITHPETARSQLNIDRTFEDRARQHEGQPSVEPMTGDVGRPPRWSAAAMAVVTVVSLVFLVAWYFGT